MREIQEVLCDLWDLQEREGCGESPEHQKPRPCSQKEDLFRVLTNTHRELQTLREGIGTLQGLLPSAVVEARQEPLGGFRSNSPSREGLTRAFEILRDARKRLDSLTLEFENQGVSPE